jgi:hypothetical protein
MTDDIIRMAREAGATPYTNRHYPDRPTHTFTVEQLARFAALVRADERKACCSAEVLNAANINGADLPHQVYEKYTAAIMARGNT